MLACLRYFAMMDKESTLRERYAVFEKPVLDGGAGTISRIRPRQQTMAEELILLVKRIKEPGFPLHARVGPESIDLRFVGFSFQSPVEVSMTANLVSREILLRGGVHTACLGECSRCLEPVEFSIDLPELILVYENTGQDFLDISDEVRDEILLSLPTKMLCSDECRGMCAGCRVNLNREECRCVPRRGPGPFDQLG